MQQPQRSSRDGAASPGDPLPVRVLETGDWSLLLGDEWIAEQDEDSILIGDRDGVGCLEISELRREQGQFGEADLDELMEAGQDASAIRCGNFRGRVTRFAEDGAALRQWCLYTADLLLYITYSCDADNDGLDDAAVDEMLATLHYAPQD
jgi:hypothetical protein